MTDLLAHGLRRLVVASLLAGCAVSLAADRVGAAEEVAPPGVDWSFSGPFGTFDRAQLQRGYKVYREVCSACHSMRMLSFRNLAEPGGLEFSEAEVKALAAEFEVEDGPDDEGEMFTRAGLPSDRFPSPFANEQAARAANNGALPPDLSVMAKARPHGPDYIHALLAGYEEPPTGFELREGMNYNAYFPGRQIAMAPPLGEGVVEYTDGSPETVEQYASDVTAFLMWAAEPKLEARHRMGFNVMIYLLILTGLLYAAKRRLFAGVAH
ncbi:MAG: cytochrome c1 [Hyphomicrobiales bacterium]|jgi:cytochrome c1|nr:cytochrome c1 [Hyphomicrobiales bacterium]